MNLFGLMRRRRDDDRLTRAEETHDQDIQDAAGAYQPTTDELTLVQTVKDRFETARQARRAHHRRWAENAAFYRGDHWVRWNAELGTLLDADDGASWEQRIQDNQIPQLALQWVAHQVGNRHVTTGSPNDPNDPNDAAAAELATKVLRHLDQICRRAAKRRRLNYYRAIYGLAVLHEWWDNDAFTRVATVDPVTNAVRSHRVRGGDVQWDVLSPWEVFPEPVSRASDLQWCISCRIQSRDWIRSRFRDRGHLVTTQPADAIEVDQAPQWSGSDESGFGVGDGIDGIIDSAAVMWYYEAPCGLYPEGRWAVVAGDTLLYYEQQLPHPSRTLPFIFVQGLPDEDSLFGKAVIDDLIGQQRLLNRIESDVATNSLLTSHPKLLAPREGNLDEDAGSGMPGEVIEWDAAGGVPPPSWMTPPTIPGYTAQLPDQIRDRMGVIAGVNEILARGSAPGGVTAARAIELLAMQDQTRLSLTAEAEADAVLELDKRLLELVAERYTVPRLIQVLGNSTTPDSALAFVGSDLGGNLDVRLDSTPGANETVLARRERLMSYIQAGLVPVQDPGVLAEFLTMLEEPELSRLVAEWAQRQAEQAQAAAEQQAQMATAAGAPMPGAPVAA